MSGCSSGARMLGRGASKGSGRKVVWATVGTSAGCARPGRPPSDESLAKCFVRAAQIWNRVEKTGIPNVKGVWSIESGCGSLVNVISIKQAYPGHSRQALVLAAQVLGGAYNGRFVVAVDDDIDPTNTFDVLWAMATRCT